MAAPETGPDTVHVPDDHLMGVYARAPLAFERGRGVRLYTAEGEEYLDAMAGIAVTALGHAHPTLVKAGTSPTSSAFLIRKPWPQSCARSASPTSAS
jgi:acetylornithine/succinyldiaminopimelate/putrescine aminotransferase